MSSSSASKRKSSDSRRSSSGNNPSATLSGSGVQGEANSKPRASVFSRLGTKGGGQAWSEGRDGRERDRDREKERKGATPKRPGETALCTKYIYGRKFTCSINAAGKDSSVSGSKKPLSGKGGAGSGHRNSPAIDTNWEAWNEKNLDHDDELMLEKKRQLLKRELAKEVKDGKPKPEAGAGVSAQKRTGQSSRQAENMLMHMWYYIQYSTISVRVHRRLLKTARILQDRRQIPRQRNRKVRIIRDFPED